MPKFRGLSVFLGVIGIAAQPALGLPPPDDVPEEVLRTEIITEARSPIDGKSLTASEYSQLQAQLTQRAFPPQIDPKIREVIFLLRLRHFLRTVTPL